MSRSDTDYLRHILDEIEYLIEVSSACEYDAFLLDETLKRAFVRSIEIIGEATKHLSDELTQEHPEIDWRGMAGMRDRLIHAYFGVDYDLVWDVVRNKIPPLKVSVRAIIDHP